MFAIRWADRALDWLFEAGEARLPEWLFEAAITPIAWGIALPWAAWIHVEDWWVSLRTSHWPPR